MFIKSLEQFKNTYPLYILILSLGAFFLPFIYFDSLIHKSVLTKYIFIALISISSFSTWLISTRKSKTNHFYYNSLFSLLIFIFFFAALSILWSQFKGSYQAETIHFACLLLLAFVTMQIKTLRSIQLLLFSAVIGGAIATFLAFLQVWGWNPFNYTVQGFPAASFINKNYLANYIDLLFPISLFLLIAIQGDSRKWIISLSVSLFFSYLIFSHNRASWLSLLSIFILILYLSHKYSWVQERLKNIDTKYVFLILLSSILLINSPGSTIDETDRFKGLYGSLESTEVTSSTTMRLNAYKSAIVMISEQPVLGTGLGSFQITFKPYDSNLKRNIKAKSTFIQLHNDPLQIFVELGLIGGLLVIIFVLILFYENYKRISDVVITNSSNQHSTLYLGLLLSITASIIHSFLDFPLHLPASAFLIFIFIGFLMHASIKTKKVFFNFKVIFSILIIAIAILSVNFYSSFIRSSYALNSAIKNILTHNPKQGYKPLNKPQHKNNCKSAKINVDKSLKEYSNDFHIQTWAFVIYTECNEDQAELLKLSQKVLSDNPYHSAALESSASISFNEKDYSSAKRYYQILHYLYPLNAGYTLLLGHVAVKQKDYNLAYNFYKKTLKLQPQNKIAPDMVNQLTSKGYIKTESTKK